MTLTLEQNARLRLAAAGGAISIRPLDLMLTEDPEEAPSKISSVIGIHFGFLVHFGSVDRNSIVLEFHRGWRVLVPEDEEKVFSYIVDTYRMPGVIEEFGLSYEEAMNLYRMNESFIREHGTLDHTDLALIRAAQKAMADAQSAAAPDTPIPGDVVEGAYYDGKYPFGSGVVVSTPSWGFGVHFCAHAYCPWLTVNNDGKPHVNTSGGPFFSADKTKYEPIGETTRLFCDFGHAGPCGNGSIRWPAKVRAWRLSKDARI